MMLLLFSVPKHYRSTYIIRFSNGLDPYYFVIYIFLRWIVVGSLSVSNMCGCYSLAVDIFNAIFRLNTTTIHRSAYPYGYIINVK